MGVIVLLFYYKKKNFFVNLGRQRQLLYMSLPIVLYIILFTYVPLWGWTMGFQNYRPQRAFSAQEWVGIRWFKFLFEDPVFLRTIRNTIAMSFINTTLGFITAIGLALLLNEVRKIFFKRFIQTISYLPHFLSWVIIGGIALQLFSGTFGVINNLIEAAGGGRIPFLTEKYHWAATYVLTGVWQSMGWGTILYLAAISNINPELYEAAIVDGAGRFRQCISITLPCIRPTVVILLIMSLGRLMGGSFERIYAMHNPMVFDFSTTIPVLVYRWGILSSQFSRATALGLFQSLIGLILVITADRIAKKLGEDGLL